MDQKVKKRLSRVIQAAYETTPYFNNIINGLIDDTDEINAELFDKIPIFNKQTIREVGWPNFIATDFLDENHEPLLTSGARSERTSGTTGTSMQIIWNQNDYLSSIMNHWKFRNSYFNITPNSRMCTSTRRLPKNQLFSIDGNQLIISTSELSAHTIPLIIQAINAFQPEWFYIQNSLLYVLVYVAKQDNLTFPKSVRYIEYIGEPLCDYYRRIIAEHIPVPVSNMYGCTETNGISYECVCGNNHLMQENVLVELVDLEGRTVKEGTSGYVCVTGLHNTAMPILRYRLNDLAIIDTQTHCKCGNPHPIIDIKAARMPEFLILDDPFVFPSASLYIPIREKMDLFHIEKADIAFNYRMKSLEDYDILVYQNMNNSLDVGKLLTELFAAYQLLNIKFTIHKIEQADSQMPIGMLRLR